MESDADVRMLVQVASCESTAAQAPTGRGVQRRKADAVMLGAVLLRFASPAGPEGGAAGSDPAIGSRIAAHLDGAGVHLATAVVRAAVADGWAGLPAAPQPSAAGGEP